MLTEIKLSSARTAHEMDRRQARHNRLSGICRPAYRGHGSIGSKAPAPGEIVWNKPEIKKPSIFNRVTSWICGRFGK